MLDKLAQLQQECEKLGLVEESRVLQAWLSTEMPHLTEESRVVKEIYTIFRNVAGLPPNIVPATSYHLKTIVYSTEGKSVRKIIGELGYILQGVYQKGYLTHDITRFTPTSAERHVRYGLLLKELIGLIGTYYTITRYGGAILSVEEQLEQQYQLVNNKIVSLFKKLEEALVRVRSHANEMLTKRSPIRSRFFQSDEELQKQSDAFFDGLDDLLFTIRRFFYHKARLTKDDIEQAILLLTKLRQFFKSLERLGSGLDLKGGDFSLSALLFWSTVFAEEEGQRSGVQQQREVLDEISEIPYLQRYSDVVETGSPLMKERSREILRLNRDVSQTLFAYVDAEKKISEFKEVLQKRVEYLETLETHLKDLEKKRIDMLAKGTSLTEVSSLTQMIGPVTKESGDPNSNLRAVFPELPKEGLVEYFKENKSLDDLVVRAQAMREKTATVLSDLSSRSETTGFSDRDVIELQSLLFIVAQRLGRIAMNPMEYLHPHEQFWIPLLSFGNPYDEEGRVTPEFKELIQQMYGSRAEMLGEEGTESVGVGLNFVAGDLMDEKVQTFAKRLSEFNQVIKDLLSGKNVSLPEGQLRELERFILAGTAENKDWPRKFLDYREKQGLEGEPPSMASLLTAEGDPLTETLEKLTKIPPTFDDWLSGKASKKAAFTKPLVRIASVVQNVYGDTIEVHVRVASPKPGEPLAFKFILEIDGAPQRRAYDCHLNVVTEKGEVDEVDYISIKGNEESSFKLSAWITQKMKEIEAKFTLEGTTSEVLKSIFSWILDKDNAALEEASDEMEVEEDLVDAEEELPVETVSPPKVEPKKPIDLKGIPLRGTEEDGGKGKKEKEKESRVHRMVTLKQNISRFDLSLPSASTSSGYAKMLSSRKDELLSLRDQLKKFSEESYKKMREVVDRIEEDLFESSAILPPLPRIVYSVYSPTKKAKGTWSKWKQQKIELPMHELSSLLENLEEYKEIAEQAEEEEVARETKVPTVTIDFIERKFEELRKLAS